MPGRISSARSGVGRSVIRSRPDTDWLDWPPRRSTGDQEVGTEAGLDPMPVDVQRLQDLQHLPPPARGRMPPLAPAEDVQVLPAGPQPPQDLLQHLRAPELPLQQAEVPPIQLDPEDAALQVLDPTFPQEADPVVPDPVADGRLAQVVARLLALDPLVALGLGGGIVVQAQ